MYKSKRHGQHLLITTFLLLFFSITQSKGQTSSEFIFVKKKKKVSIPFKMINNLMIIPLKINNSDTLNFILDTGVSKTIMTNLYFEGSIQLNQARDVKLSGLGGGDPIPAIISSENQIALGGAVGNDQEIYVLLEDIFFLSSSMGIQVHGLIGFSIFNNFIVEIDYPSKVITLYPPEKYKRKKKKGERFPISLERSKPYIEAVIFQQDSSSTSTIETDVKLLIDTGASHALSLYDYKDQRILLPSKSFRSYLGRGLNGDIFGEIGRLPSFTLGSFQFEDLVVSYPDEDDVAIAMKLSDRSGSLGSEILRRFNVVIDYHNKEIILSKNKTYKSRFVYNMSGIDVATPIPGINYYKVSQVRKDSPAHKAGIKRGDDIISVNGTTVDLLTLGDLVKLFHGKPNRKLRLRVLRNGQSIKFEIELKELI